jgi:Glycine zipper
VRADRADLLRNNSVRTRLISSRAHPNFMRMNTPILVSGISLSCLVLTSCDTPVGQGAAWGAATGAFIGAAATGNVRAASIGAAAGAAAGALTGKIVQEKCAIGWKIRVFLQPLYRSRLRSTRCAARWTHSRR